MPKRYDLEWTGTAYQQYREMTEDSLGQYVLYEEYEKLQARVAELEEFAERLIRAEKHEVLTDTMGHLLMEARRILNARAALEEE